jgi:hypothetical protein
VIERHVRGIEDGPKTNHPPATMFRHIRIGFARALPQPDSAEPRIAWSNEDSSWHHSSFELARGLEVIEHCEVTPAVFVDSAATFDPRKA